MFRKVVVYAENVWVKPYDFWSAIVADIIVDDGSTVKSYPYFEYAEYDEDGNVNVFRSPRCDRYCEHNDGTIWDDLYSLEETTDGEFNALEAMKMVDDAVDSVLVDLREVS